MPSPHFTPELFAFLRRLKKNNDRGWFQANKPAYVEHVRDPLLRFIEDFAPKLRRISANLVADARPTGGSMFRIHRDVRFSKDKSPYKTAATAQFRHEAGRDVHAPGFYLHLEPKACGIGTGIWHPDSPSLARIRQKLVDETARWKRIQSAAPFKRHLRLAGESLKRPPRGFDPDHPLIEDLKRKDLVTWTEFDEKDACKPGFIDHFVEVCRAGKPLMKFLGEAVGQEV